MQRYGFFLKIREMREHFFLKYSRQKTFVVAMGLEKISFGWYARHISWAALIGYLAGIVSYYLLRTFVF